MTPDDPNTDDDDSDAPSLRQRLHSATGDRHAEAEALADRADDAVSENDAEIAVREAHGDIQPGREPGAEPAATEQPTPSDVASVADAEAVRARKSN